MDLLNNQGLGSNGGGYFVDSGNNLYNSKIRMEQMIRPTLTNPYQTQTNWKDADLLNGQGLGQAMNAYSIASEQPSNGANVARGAGSMAGYIVPGAGLIGEGIAGLMEHNANQKAETRMESELNRQRANRNFIQNKYLGELDQDAARRQAMLRGQVANTPYYQQQMSQLANNYSNTSRMNADNQAKMGMGDKSGMTAQLAGQNLSSMTNAATSGTAGALGGQNRVYGGLGTTSLSSAPEVANLNMAQNQYNDSSDYGNMYSNLMKLGNSKSMDYIRNNYNEGINNQISTGFGKQGD